jgi:hypothetical protein
VNCSHKLVFTSIAQAGDSGLQASPELAPLDVRTLLVNMGTALFVSLANLTELGERHQAWS